MLDCDPGHDDAIALLMAVAHPAIDLRAVTCVAGNVSLAYTQENARRVLTVAGRTDIPVAAGLDRPLIRELVTAPEVHGATGLGGTTTPEPDFELDSRHAIDLMVETFEESAGDIVLVPTGPLSNIAMLLRRAPHIKEKIPRIILMGGAYGQGNHSPSAEFNIFVDPEAAAIVFSSGIPITMVGLDVTHQARAGQREVEVLRAMGNPVADLVADMIGYYSDFHQKFYGWDTVPVHDACCVAELISPGLIVTQLANVQIETISDLTRGRTVCDLRGKSKLPATADVGIGIDGERFLEIMMDCIRRY